MLRKHKKAFLIYPENKVKAKWDVFMTIVLIISCMTTPLVLAFTPKSGSTGELNWLIINSVIDILFFVDICVTFNTATYDGYFQIIED